MRKVKLLEAWGMHIKGDSVTVSDIVAENLIKGGVARDPNAPAPEPEPEPKTPSPEPEVPPRSTKKKVAKTKGGKS